MRLRSLLISAALLLSVSAVGTNKQKLRRILLLRQVVADDTGVSTDQSTNGYCGGNTGFDCYNYPGGRCCSSTGVCGNTAAECGTDCQSEFGECDLVTNSTQDGKCGAAFNLNCLGYSGGECCNGGQCSDLETACDPGSGCDPSFGNCLDAVSTAAPSASETDSNTLPTDSAGGDDGSSNPAESAGGDDGLLDLSTTLGVNVLPDALPVTVGAGADVSLGLTGSDGSPSPTIASDESSPTAITDIPVENTSPGDLIASTTDIPTETSSLTDDSIPSVTDVPPLGLTTELVSEPTLEPPDVDGTIPPDVTDIPDDSTAPSTTDLPPLDLTTEPTEPVSETAIPSISSDESIPPVTTELVSEPTLEPSAIDETSPPDVTDIPDLTTDLEPTQTEVEETSLTPSPIETSPNLTSQPEKTSASQPDRTQTSVIGTESTSSSSPSPLITIPPPITIPKPTLQSSINSTRSPLEPESTSSNQSPEATETGLSSSSLTIPSPTATPPPTSTPTRPRYRPQSLWHPNRPPTVPGDGVNGYPPPWWDALRKRYGRKRRQEA